MSGDPVTMFRIASFAFQAVGTVSDINESKRQSDIEQQKYELKMKEANLQGLTDENNRKEEAEKTKKHNLAILSGSGYNDDSRSFININKQVDLKAQKDVTTIRLNTGSQINELSLSAQAAKSGRKSEQFGGWMSIGGKAMETAAKIDAFSKPKTKDKAPTKWDEL
tara:strand:- start:3896 stop:4393 length:498 start_codon:yes stop_codon:yes gene_type:complete